MLRTQEENLLCARDGRGRHAEGGVGAAAPRRHQPAREITDARGAAERGERARRPRAVRRRRRRLRQLCDAVRRQRRVRAAGQAFGVRGGAEV